MTAMTWGATFNKPGWIAILGEDSEYTHRFGGQKWQATGPLDHAYGRPILLLTLDLNDTRLAGLGLDNSCGSEIPLFSYINGMTEPVQRYTVNHDNKTVTFVEATALNETLEPLSICPNPLPTRALDLRPMNSSELPTNEPSYWTACDTFVGGDGWLRIGGPPLWLYDPEQHVSRDGEPMTYVAAIGYDTNADSPFLDDPEMLMFGEMGLYFFVSPKLSEIVVSCQST